MESRVLERKGTSKDAVTRSISKALREQRRARLKADADIARLERLNELRESSKPPLQHADSEDGTSQRRTTIHREGQRSLFFRQLFSFPTPMMEIPEDLYANLHAASSESDWMVQVRPEGNHCVAAFSNSRKRSAIQVSFYFFTGGMLSVDIRTSRIPAGTILEGIWHKDVFYVLDILNWGRMELMHCEANDRWNIVLLQLSDDETFGGTGPSQIKFLPPAPLTREVLTTIINQMQGYSGPPAESTQMIEDSGSEMIDKGETVEDEYPAVTIFREWDDSSAAFLFFENLGQHARGLIFLHSSGMRETGLTSLSLLWRNPMNLISSTSKAAKVHLRAVPIPIYASQLTGPKAPCEKLPGEAGSAAMKDGALDIGPVAETKVADAKMENGGEENDLDARENKSDVSGGSVKWRYESLDGVECELSCEGETDWMDVVYEGWKFEEEKGRGCQEVIVSCVAQALVVREVTKDKFSLELDRAEIKACGIAKLDKEIVIGLSVWTPVSSKKCRRHSIWNARGLKPDNSSQILFNLSHKPITYIDLQGHTRDYEIPIVSPEQFFF